jgi:hypothetical protein
MNPKKPPPSAPARNGFNYRQQYGLVIVCRDEQHQARLYERLRKQGHKLKVVAV